MSSFANNDKRCISSNNNENTYNLGIDEACISIINKYNWPISLYSKFNNCHECDFIPWKNVSKNSNTTLVLSTKYLQNLYYKVIHDDDNNSMSTSCQTITYNFIEHGHYGWNLTMDNNCSQIYEIIKANNPYLPIFLAIFILLTASVIFSTTNFFINTIKNIKNNNNNNNNNNNELMENNNDDNLLTQATTSTAIIQSSSSSETNDDNDGDCNSIIISKTIPTSIKITKSSTRLQSIDTFRGISILLMIFINNGGGKYVIFNHSPWYGLTIADLVLPWFLWIMGMTMTLSLRSQLRLSITPMRIIYKGFKRLLILIILGIIINSLTSNNNNKNIENLRLFGVLQLCGISNFISLCIEIIGIKKERYNFQYRNRLLILSYLQDIIDAWKQWIIVIIILIINLSLIYLLNIPNCPNGYFGPGGYDNHNKYLNCTGGANGYIDRLLLSSNHIYNKTNNIIYGKINNYDPEGLLNILSSILTVQFGIHAGRILFSYYLNNISKILRWFIWSLLLAIFALILCNGDIYNPNGIIPISKNIMSLSFILLTCSLAFLLYLILYYLIDHLNIWNGSPFIYSGRNSIFIYMAHYLTMNCFPWSWNIKSSSSTHANHLAMNIWTTILWSIIAYYMNKKDIIITV